MPYDICEEDSTLQFIEQAMAKKGTDTVYNVHSINVVCRAHEVSVALTHRTRASRVSSSILTCGCLSFCVRTVCPCHLCMLSSV